MTTGGAAVAEAGVGVGEIRTTLEDDEEAVGIAVEEGAGAVESGWS